MYITYNVNGSHFYIVLLRYKYLVDAIHMLEFMEYWTQLQYDHVDYSVVELLKHINCNDIGVDLPSILSCFKPCDF